MRKLFKNIAAVAAAMTMALGAGSLAACAPRFAHPSGLPGEGVSSNGGYVVSAGEYYYFINGVEEYTAPNDYGVPVKGTLMRVKKADLAAKKGDSECIVPSIMVAGDHTSGLYVYGDRIYYATPTSARNASGVVENTYLDFASAKLDGSDVKTHFRVSSNSTVYRYVRPEENSAVYVIYATGTSSFELHSYNTADGTDTVLAAGVTQYVLDSTDKTNPWIYYTMGVTDKADTDGPITLDYNQLYRVRADRTEAAYEYMWDEEYLKENNGGAAPYTNLGELVLDGRGVDDALTQFNHAPETTVPSSPVGYTYTLRSYNNGGIYFTRSQTSTTSGTAGADGALYFLAEEAFKADGWDSVAGNGGALDVVANAVYASSKATDAALFYRDEAGHHYLYVSNDTLCRADVRGDGSGLLDEDIDVAFGVSGATIVSIDNTSDPTYDYVYFTRSETDGMTVERAVYNGTADNYRNLTYGDENNAAYRAVQVLDIHHASDWYNFEVLDGIVFYADAMSFGSNKYNYVSAVDLKQNGTLMNNVQLEAFNDKYGEIMDSDKATGYLARLRDESNTKLATALEYFFYTGKTEQFKENIDGSVRDGKSETFLYTKDEQDAFYAFAEGTGATEGRFVDEAGSSYRTYAYFRTVLGEMSEEDEETFAAHWTDTLQHYTAPASEDSGLPAWAWALIGVGIGVVVLGGAGLTVFLVLRNKKKHAAPKAERMHVDTTDDRSVDVYALDEPEANAEGEAAPEEPEAPEAETVSEAPEAEEPAPEAEREESGEAGEEPPAE